MSPFSEAPSHKMSAHTDGSDFDNEPHKMRNQILSVLFAFGAMLGYAILTGIISIERVQPGVPLGGPSHTAEEEEEEEEDWINFHSIMNILKLIPCTAYLWTIEERKSIPQ